MSSKLKRTLALALTGGALAIGVPAALAAGGDDASGSSSGAAPAFVQEQQPDQQRPDRGDCPEQDGAQGGSGESGADQGGTTEAPSI